MLTDAEIINQFSVNSKVVLEKRYLRKDAEGKVVESIPEMYRRIAKHIAAVDENTEQAEREFYEFLSDLRFIPNSPVFTGAGTPLGQLAACFVLPISDDMGKTENGIFSTLRNMALIQQSGGGTGFDFSNLRPRGSLVNSSNGKATGPVGFIKIFDAAGNEIGQGGVRRSASMAVLRVDHPDIEEFITCKDKEGEIKNFNLSVALTDDFMQAVENNGDWELKFPDVKDPNYRKFELNIDKAQSCGVKIVTHKTVKARDLFDKIVAHAWKNGEPGILFIDRVNSDNSLAHIIKYSATNPCVSGETVVVTPDGPCAVRTLVGIQADLLLNGEFYQTTGRGFFQTGIISTLEFKTERGLKIRVTKDHKMRALKNGVCDWIMAGDLEIGDGLRLSVDYGLNDWPYDFIESICECDPEPVFDVQIPGVNAFSANGFVVHNCGEVFLFPYENCCLGSINLVKHVKNGQIDFDLLKETVRKGVRFLDNVIDANQYVPSIPKLKETAQSFRRIGLGIMGLADVMYMLGLRYGSEESLEFASNLMKFIRCAAENETYDLGKSRGNYPMFDSSSQNKDGDYRRNITLLAIAPTGTIATVAGVEGYGCEPVFALAYSREVVDGDKKIKLHYGSPLFVNALKKAGVTDIDGILAEVAKTGSCQNVAGVPDSVKNVFVVSSDIKPEDHVKMQAALQEFVDSSISKTVNMPNDATVADVESAYKMAWKLGCKGLTVYRAGSRESEVLRVEKKIDNKAEEVLKRPGRLAGYTYRTPTPSGTAYTTINENKPGEPLEVFLNVGKAGSEIRAVAEAIGRLISLLLRIPSSMTQRERLKEIIEQLQYIGGGRPLGFGHNRVLSLPDGIARALKEYEGSEEERSGGGDLCPICGQATMIYMEGCSRCTNCGNSGC